MSDGLAEDAAGPQLGEELRLAAHLHAHVHQAVNDNEAGAARFPSVKSRVPRGEVGSRMSIATAASSAGAERPGTPAAARAGRGRSSARRAGRRRRAHHLRDARRGRLPGTGAVATACVRSVSASEIWRFTAASCRQSDAAMRHSPSFSDMKSGCALVRKRRGEKTSAGSQVGRLPRARDERRGLAGRGRVAAAVAVVSRRRRSRPGAARRSPAAGRA